MSRPKVSIIIPVYNKGKYIETVLKTIECQSFLDFEVIVVNDGSTDNSLDILNRFCDRDQFVIISQSNKGVAAARNTGLRYAQGEWIWFIDADDEPNREFLSCVGHLLNNQNIDMIFAPFFKVCSNGRTELVSVQQSERIVTDRLPSIYMNNQYLNGYFGYLWCKLIRKSFICKCEATFLEGLTLAEDWKFLVSLYSKQPTCVFVDCWAMKYNTEAENSSSEKAIDYKAQLRIQYEVYLWMNDFGNNEYILQMQDRICGYIAYIFIEAFDKKGNFRDEKIWLNRHQEYVSLLNEERLHGSTKTIIKLVKCNQYKTLYCKFKMRKAIRTMYHGVMKK